MSRPSFRGYRTVSSLAFAAALAFTGQAVSKTKPKQAKPAAKTGQTGAANIDTKNSGKPSQLASYGDWWVFLALTGNSRTCYTLAAPKERAPSGLNRDPAYVFISNRPSENVRQEISMIMGFPVKEGAAARAEIGGNSFDLVAKGASVWIKNQAEERHFVEALKKGSKLIVKAPSQKGNVTIDSYSLAGLSQALERVEKECP